MDDRWLPTFKWMHLVVIVPLSFHFSPQNQLLFNSSTWLTVIVAKHVAAIFLTGLGFIIYAICDHDFNMRRWHLYSPPLA